MTVITGRATSEAGEFHTCRFKLFLDLIGRHSAIDHVLFQRRLDLEHPVDFGSVVFLYVGNDARHEIGQR